MNESLNEIFAKREKNNVDYHNNYLITFHGSYHGLINS